MDVLPDDAHGATVIQKGRTDIAAALNQAHDDWVVGLAAEVSRTFGFARPRQFGFVGFHDLASATSGVSEPPGAMAKRMRWPRCQAVFMPQPRVR